MSRRVLDPTAPPRECSVCQKWHNPHFFPHHGPLCRQCHERKKQRDYRRRGYCPERQRGRLYLQRYGVTAEWVDERSTALDGRCAICRELPLTTSGRLLVDHCHASGAVRDLLCRRCNNVLGWVGDSRELLAALSAYLERFLTTR